MRRCRFVVCRGYASSSLPRFYLAPTETKKTKRQRQQRQQQHRPNNQIDVAETEDGSLEPRDSPSLLRQSATIMLPADQVKHARVLRLKADQRIEVCDGKGTVAQCVLLNGEQAFVESLCKTNWRGTKWNVAVASGSIKGSRGDWLVEKLCELGAWSFRPLLTDHSARMGSKGGQREQQQIRESISGREDRWKRLAVAASKQCRRDHFMEMLPAMSLDEILLDMSSSNSAEPKKIQQELVLAAHQTGEPLRNFSLNRMIVNNKQQEGEGEGENMGTLLVGPEGDFSQRELQLLQESDRCSLVGLGDLRLRVETAALALMTGVRLLEI